MTILPAFAVSALLVALTVGAVALIRSGWGNGPGAA